MLFPGPIAALYIAKHFMCTSREIRLIEIIFVKNIFHMLVVIVPIHMDTCALEAWKS